MDLVAEKLVLSHRLLQWCVHVCLTEGWYTYG